MRTILGTTWRTRSRKVCARPSSSSSSSNRRTRAISWAAGIMPAPLLLFRVDLRSLQPAAEIDVDRLPFREDVEGGNAGLAMAVAGRLGPAEREVDLGANRRGVHVEDPRVHVAHGCERFVHVARIDRGGQPVGDAVA